MPWTSRFKPPIALKDGRTIETLADARAMILGLPEHQQPRPYAQLLMAARRQARAIEQAYWQFMRALKADRMMK